MTATCRVCGCEIAERFVGSSLVWGHLTNPRNEHHYAKPVRDALRGGADVTDAPGRLSSASPERAGTALHSPPGR